VSNTYKLGTSVKVSVAFQDVDGAAGDPATVKCEIRKAGGTPTVYVYPTDPGIVKDGVGLYHFWIVTNIAGTYKYEWVGSGGIDVSNDSEFDVEDTFDE
jgi:hypothetical protein